MNSFKPHTGYLSIKKYHQEDRPREKLIDRGKEQLSKAELLAMVINTGLPNINSVDLARSILKKYNNNLSNLAQLSVKELMEFPGIGQAKAATIVGVLELARRLQRDQMTHKRIIKQSQDIYDIMKQKLQGKIVEEFWIMLLNGQNKVIKLSQISKGGLAKTAVDIQVVLKECLLYNATNVVLIHNHPSGSIKPSLPDIELTKKIILAGRTMSIRIVEHIIFTDKAFFSFADEGFIDSLRLP